MFFKTTRKRMAKFVNKSSKSTHNLVGCRRRHRHRLLLLAIGVGAWKQNFSRSGEGNIAKILSAQTDKSFYMMPYLNIVQN